MILSGNQIILESLNNILGSEKNIPPYYVTTHLQARSVTTSNMEGYERIIAVKNEVFVYKIPPRQSARAYRAADWKLDEPSWTGRLRIVLINNRCLIKFEDKTSGELFAEAPIDTYPGPSVESVADSSRYFVVKIVDPSGRHAFIGIGFADRGDSFDFNVSLQDHFKREKVDEVKVTEEPARPPIDLSFKEGQTIKINIAGSEAKAPRPKPSGGGGIGILPPPPSGTIPKLAAPGAGGIRAPPAARAPAAPVPMATPAAAAAATTTGSDWGDFSSSAPSAAPSQGWVQF